MSNQPDPADRPAPPPIPSRPPTMPYAGPAPKQPVRPPGSDAQRVFDTVGGPNVRLLDNLVQLACVVVGGAIGAVAGWLLSDGDDRASFIIGGGLGGVLVGLLLSGLVIGIVRGVKAMRR